MKKNSFLIIGIIFFMFMSESCSKVVEPQKQKEYTPSKVEKNKPSSASIPVPTDSLKQETMTIGNSVKGKPIEMILLEKKESSSAEKNNPIILILGSVQGNEPAGTIMINKLIEHLQTHVDILDNRKVLLIPKVNPDGIELYSRYNANKVDINRNFPVVKHNLSNLQPETQAVVKTIMKYSPDRIIVIRQLGYTDFDFSREKRKERDQMAQYLRKCCPNLNASDGITKPGSIGKFGSEIMGIAVISLGLSVNADKLKTQQVWSEFGDSLIALIAFPSDIRGDLLVEKTPAKPEIPDQPQKTYSPCFIEGKNIFRQGNYSSAKDKFNECLKTDKDCQLCGDFINRCDNAIKAFDRGLLLYQQNDCNGAVSEFRKVTRMNRRDEKAQKYIKLCQEKNRTPVTPPNEPPEEQGKSEIEEETILPAPKSENSTDELHYQKGVSYLKEQNWDKAIEEFGLVMKNDPKYKNVKNLREMATHLKEGIELFNKGEFHEAASVFKRTEQIESNPTALDYLYKSHYQIGMESFNQKDYLNARDQFKVSKQYNKNCTQCIEYISKCEELFCKTHYDTGTDYFLNKQYDEAIHEWELVKKVNPSYKDVNQRINAAKEDKGVK